MQTASVNNCKWMSPPQKLRKFHCGIVIDCYQCNKSNFHVAECFIVSFSAVLQHTQSDWEQLQLRQKLIVHVNWQRGSEKVVTHSALWSSTSTDLQTPCDFWLALDPWNWILREEVSKVKEVHLTHLSLGAMHIGCSIVKEAATGSRALEMCSLVWHVTLTKGTRTIRRLWVWCLPQQQWLYALCYVWSLAEERFGWRSIFFRGQFWPFLSSKMKSEPFIKQKDFKRFTVTNFMGTVCTSLLYCTNLKKFMNKQLLINIINKNESKFRESSCSIQHLCV